MFVTLRFTRHLRTIILCHLVIFYLRNKNFDTWFCSATMTTIYILLTYDTDEVNNMCWIIMYAVENKRFFTQVNFIIIVSTEFGQESNYFLGKSTFI